MRPLKTTWDGSDSETEVSAENSSEGAASTVFVVRSIFLLRLFLFMIFLKNDNIGDSSGFIVVTIIAGGLIVGFELEPPEQEFPDSVIMPPTVLMLSDRGSFEEAEPIVTM